MIAWSHVALNCTDMVKTEIFYRRWFNFEPVRRVDYTANDHSVFLRNGEVLLELANTSTQPPLEFGTGVGPLAPSVARHIAFQTDNLDALIKDMGSEALITAGPFDQDALIPGWKSVWIRDPDGVIIELTQGFKDDKDVSMSLSSTNGEEAQLAELINNAAALVAPLYAKARPLLEGFMEAFKKAASKDQ